MAILDQHNPIAEIAQNPQYYKFAGFLLIFLL